MILFTKRITIKKNMVVLSLNYLNLNYLCHLQKYNKNKKKKKKKKKK